MFLTDRDGKWFMDKHKSKIPPMERPRLSKEEKKKEKKSNKILKKITNIGMIGISKSIGIIWSGLFPKVVMRRKKFL